MVGSSNIYESQSVVVNRCDHARTRNMVICASKILMTMFMIVLDLLLSLGETVFYF